MKKILVTGGSGWIGKYVVHSLIQKDMKFTLHIIEIDLLTFPVIGIK